MRLTILAIMMVLSFSSKAKAAAAAAAKAHAQNAPGMEPYHLKCNHAQHEAKVCSKKLQKTVGYDDKGKFVYNFKNICLACRNDRVNSYATAAMKGCVVKPNKKVRCTAAQKKAKVCSRHLVKTWGWDVEGDLVATYSNSCLAC